MRFLATHPYTLGRTPLRCHRRVVDPSLHVTMDIAVAWRPERVGVARASGCQCRAAPYCRLRTRCCRIACRDLCARLRRRLRHAEC